jgi:hypothetical protein
MKKLTIFMMLAALAMPAMQAQNKVAAKPADKAKLVFVRSAVKADVPEGYAQITITVLDTETPGGGVWNDGSGYQMLLDADATAYGSIIPETGALTTGGDVPASTYAEFEYKIPENADGALATTNMLVSGSLSAQIPAGTYDYCITNPTPGDRMWIASNNGTIGGRYDNFEFQSRFSYEFVIALVGENDATDLFVDDPTAPQVPTEISVVPGATTAEVSWTPGENNLTWNLRYALASEAADPVMYDFANGLGDWTTNDADGDGYDWGVENGAAMSASYVSGAGVTPDNWLISPTVKLGGTLKYETWNYSTYYAEPYEVYVIVDGVQNKIANYTCAGSTDTHEFIELDLSSFSGDGQIAFRHYGSTDMWKFYIDNVEIIPGANWTVVNGVESPYTIEGLTPETEYVVEVQGTDEAKRVSPWSDPVNFTTLAEGQEPEETTYYITGGFNNWNADDPDELTEEGYTFTAVDNGGQFDLDFKLLTAGENDWIWIGGIDETGAHCFAITEDLMTSGTEITLYDDGENFRLPAAGTYTVTLVREEGAKGLIEGAKIVVTKENDPITVGVNDINAKAVAGVKYYNLAGVESNKPFDGVNVMVTTYTDGTKAAAKVIK